MNSQKTGHMEAIIMPTCVPQDRDDVARKIKQISQFSSRIHIDIDDGIMTPETSWPYAGKGKLGDLTGELGELIKTFETNVVKTVDNFLIQVHLMVSEPREIGKFFIKLGADSLVLHVESHAGDARAIRATIDAWRAQGARKIGLAILLDTPLENLDPLLPSCDFVHVLSVATIGAQGAPFDPRAIGRIQEICAKSPSLPISVDGGVSLDTIEDLARAGASSFSIGAAISQASDPALAYAQLREAAQNALQ